MAPSGNNSMAMYESKLDSVMLQGAASGFSIADENSADDQQQHAHISNSATRVAEESDKVALASDSGSSAAATEPQPVSDSGTRKKSPSPPSGRRQPSRSPGFSSATSGKSSAGLKNVSSSKNVSSAAAAGRRDPNSAGTDAAAASLGGSKDRRSPPIRDREGASASGSRLGKYGGTKSGAGIGRDNNSKQVLQANGTVRVKGRRSFGDFPIHANGSSGQGERSPKALGSDRAPGASASASSLHAMSKRSGKLASSADSAALGKMKRAERGDEGGSGSPGGQQGSGELPSANSGSSIPRAHHPQQQSSHAVVGGLRGPGLHTVPVPFHFATDRRASTGGRPVSSPPAEMEKKPNQPSAGHLPSSLKAPKVPPKPSPKPATAPCPFKLESVRRHEAAMEKLKAEVHAKKSEEERQRTFRAQPVAAATPFVPHRSAVPPTHAKTFQFASTVRAEKRREFQMQLEEKENTKEGGGSAVDRRSSMEGKILHGGGGGGARTASPKLTRIKTRTEGTRTGNDRYGGSDAKKGAGRRGVVLTKSKSANASMSSSDGVGGTLSNGGDSNTPSDDSSDYRNQANDPVSGQSENGGGLREEVSVGTAVEMPQPQAAAEISASS
ncbi:hypothetical protein CBR_g36575 [Chara braunii]|uniref:TPX2 C-terminal domain-containing protein n=1 Tax=Chara braunii TaxID=69332 RepID=A0A388JZ55_CHABU|nr:hypothetical protein CBR_g36575 [Chara braunii]|eukprot:GBG63089.1 hypothetical protein CBR_g36575 [Chara braunii]